MNKTPLYQKHLDLGAKMVDFAGWSMPIFYNSPLKEHFAVRSNVGLFDTSHMGELTVTGSGSEIFLSHILPADIKKLKLGKAVYSCFLNNNGGFIDDIIIYKTDLSSYLICVNASNIEKDFNWLREHSLKFDNVCVKNESHKYALLALQGPQSIKCLKLVFPNHISLIQEMESFSLVKGLFDQDECLIVKTGYTGEEGVELFLPIQRVCNLWDALIDAGATPCGLAARDSLRLEAGLSLYGKEIDDNTTPYSAGLAWLLKSAENYIGRDALTKHKSIDNYKVCCFLLSDAGIARDGMKIYDSGSNIIGYVTSGGYLPTLGRSGGFAKIQDDKIMIGASIYIDIRGKRVLATIEKRPLYSKSR